MKTLINKNNPAIRITAPEIEFAHTKLIDYWRAREVGCYAASAWELKEEETIVETINVDLEKATEEYIEKRASLAPNESWDIEDMRAAVRFGAEWQKKQDELTWEDIRNIYILIDRIDRKKYPPITVGFYEEILRQFNEIKGSTTITEIETVVQNR